MEKPKAVIRFVLCIPNDGRVDLAPRKVCQVIAGPDAAEEGYIRIIDESGEDYLYPTDDFVPMELPTDAAKALAMPV